jgi:C_GCAxxG_C_C family probable redox protein
MGLHIQNKEALMEQAGKEFEKRKVCSEAILNTFNEGIGLGLNEAAIKMSTPMAGYGARCCCGALNGSVMVIGALSGRASDNTELGDFLDSLKYSKEMHQKFSQEFGAACCRVITNKQDFGSPEHMENCRHLVEKTAGILVDVINGNEGLQK